MTTEAVQNTSPIAIILCAGEASRWENYKNTKKHLVEIEGERLLDRTVSLLKRNGIKNIYIAVKEDIAEYRVDGAMPYVAKIDYKNNADADKFLSTKELWNKSGKTIVLYGDCYFTDRAMETIVHSTEKDWTLFCRPSKSKITGSPWGECFAQSFYPEHIAEHEENLHLIADLYKNNTITRCGGWEHYSAMVGRRGKEIEFSNADGSYQMLNRYFEINDWTEDFDFPEDYIRWLKLRKIRHIEETLSGPGILVLIEKIVAALKINHVKLKRKYQTVILRK